MLELHLDFETRATVNLPKAGLYVYAEHPETNIWCAAWSVGDGPVQLWLPGDPFPDEFQAGLDAGGLVFAHNASFEKVIWDHVCVPRYGWPPLDFSRFRCTAAMAAAMALPRSLADAAIAMGMPEQKDMLGKRVMLQLMKPRRIEQGSILWWTPEDVPEKHKILRDYCVQDVEVERALTKRLRPLSDTEFKIWQLDQAINTRGVRIDTPSVKLASQIVAASLDVLNRELAVRTRNACDKVGQTARLKDWLRKEGVDVESVDKASVRALLEMELDPNVRRVIEIRQEAAKSSTAKLEAMTLRTSADGRSRENLLYHGASTGRWSGKGIQLQNLPRPSLKGRQILTAFEALKAKDPAWLEIFTDKKGKTYPALSVVSDMLRGMVTAEPGAELARADLSNIEGRVLAWLAGEEVKLDRFRAFDAGTGPDIYRETAALILGIPVEDVTDEQRQAYGKVPELFLGFGGGKGAFLSAAALYGIEATDDEAEGIKVGWRGLHPKTVQFWWDLDAAAMDAVRNPGRAFAAGPIQYAVKGSIMWCRLPSGHLLSYVDPQIREVTTPWGAQRDAVTYMGVDSKTRQWSRHKGYGGHWAENVTQAVARDFMAEGMLRVEARGWPIVLTVHDEIISEVPAGTVTAQEYAAEMSVLPAWAAGLPVAAAGEVSWRYGK